MLKIINNNQNDEHVSKVHKSHTPGLIKTVFVVTKISIQPTKSGFSVNSFQRLKIFFRYIPFSTFSIVLMQRNWGQSPFYQNISPGSIR